VNFGSAFFIYRKNGEKTQVTNWTV